MIPFFPGIPIVRREEAMIITEMPHYTCGCGCESFPCTRKKSERFIKDK